jgi:hypothetical protein
MEEFKSVDLLLKKLASHVMKIFLNTQRSSFLEISEILLQIFSFSSCNECGLFT